MSFVFIRCSLRRIISDPQIPKLSEKQGTKSVTGTELLKKVQLELDDLAKMYITIYLLTSVNTR